MHTKLRAAAGATLLGLLALGVADLFLGASVSRYVDLERTNAELLTQIQETHDALQILSDSVESVSRRAQVLRILAGASPLDSGLDLPGTDPSWAWAQRDSPAAWSRDVTRTSSARATAGDRAVAGALPFDITLTAIPSGRVSSPFAAERLDPVVDQVRPHQGVDFAAPPGTPIRAPAAGVVVEVQWEEGYGEYLTIDHGHGVMTRYAHCSDILVAAGQRVRRGQKIALVGSTGEATGPHLHFEVWVDGRAVDPQRFVAPGDVITD